MRRWFRRAGASALLLGIPTAASAQAPERIVNKSDADAIFSFSLQEWNQRSHQYVVPGDSEVRVFRYETGNGVGVTDRATGFGLTVQPLYTDASGPPEMLVVTSYLPKGTIELTEENRVHLEHLSQEDLGVGYEVTVSFDPSPGIPGGSNSFDAITITITKPEESE